MKDFIAGILRRGYSNTRKYTAKDLTNRLYPLKYILEDLNNSWGHFIQENGNPFWSAKNNENRIALYHDVMGIRKFEITDAMYFHIINRFENGDAYGIDKDFNPESILKGE